VKSGDESGTPVETTQSVRALAEIVDRLQATTNGLSRSSSTACQQLPSRTVLIGIIEDLRAVLFPGYFGEPELNPESLPFHLGAILDGVLHKLRVQVRSALCTLCDTPEPSRCAECDTRALRLAQAFLSRLPDVRHLLGSDVQAAYTGDPAATSPTETILCYPGILAMTNYRLAHELYRLGVPLLPRIITEMAHSTTGIDVHPGTTIGDHFFMDHGTGVVIGETAVIGNRVRIYQGVTLGAKTFPLDKNGHPIKGIPRHPIVEDDVTIYSGATILGRITIGAGSVIGGNVWLTHSVPPNSRISQVAAREVEFVDGGGI
jgi:serine O-acetyltransferase